MFRGRVEKGNSPLRSIAHRENELETHNQNTSISEYNKDIFAHIVAEWIHLLVRKRACNEEKCKVKVCL